MKRFDIQSSFFFLTLSILICIGSVQISLGSLAKPGPGLMPFLSGVFLGIFALVIIKDALLKIPQETKKFWGTPRGLEKVLITLFSILIYIFGLNILGFLLMTGLFICFLIAFIGDEKWVTAILGGIISPLACYVLFELWLKLSLPKGFLGI